DLVSITTSGRISFRATTAPSTVRVAWYTVPIPPRPRSGPTSKPAITLGGASGAGVTASSSSVRGPVSGSVPSTWTSKTVVPTRIPSPSRRSTSGHRCCRAFSSVMVPQPRGRRVHLEEEVMARGGAVGLGQLRVAVGRPAEEEGVVLLERELPSLDGPGHDREAHAPRHGSAIIEV